MKRYTFVFSFTGECCTRSHLWVQSATARTRKEAFQRVLADVRASGADVSEYVQVADAIGPVKEVLE